VRCIIDNSDVLVWDLQDRLEKLYDLFSVFFNGFEIFVLGKQGYELSGMAVILVKDRHGVNHFWGEKLDQGLILSHFYHLIIII